MNTPDQQQLGDFEEHLLDQLKNVIATRAVDSAAPTMARAARRPRRRLVLVASAAAASAAVFGASVFGLHTSPAYAVERDPDGSINVSVYDFRDPAGLQQRLEALGVKATVDYLPPGITCKEPRADFVPYLEMPNALAELRPSKKGHYFTLHPEYIGAGQTIVYVARSYEDYEEWSMRLANGPVAPCVRVEEVRPSHSVPSEPSQGVPSQGVPSQGVPSQGVPSQGVPSQTR